jgi:tetratricopeptide (TPR) repeat protein
MKFSREQYIFSLAALAILVAFGVGAYSWMNQNPYEGLITHLDVQSDEGVRTLARQRIATAQASLQAIEDAGKEIDPNMYNAIASDALLLGDLVLARESLELSLAHNSLNGATWSSYAYTLFVMQDYENAKNAYLRAVEATPMEATYRDAIRILSQQFPEEKAKIKELYEDSVDSLGQKMFNMLGLANWYADAGDCDRSEDHFDVAKNIATSDEIRKQIVDEEVAALAVCKEVSNEAK